MNIMQLHKVRLTFSCALDQFNPYHSLTTRILHYTSNDILVDQVAFYTLIFQYVINILLTLLYSLQVSSTSTLKSKKVQISFWLNNFSSPCQFISLEN